VKDLNELSPEGSGDLASHYVLIFLRRCQEPPGPTLKRNSFEWNRAETRMRNLETGKTVFEAQQVGGIFV
jgi:hypothetical protein